LRAVIGVVAVAVATVLLVDQCHRQSISEYESRVARVEEQVRHERERAEALKRDAAEAASRADSIAASLRSISPEIRTRIVEVQAATPDSLRGEPAIVLRDSIIADLRNEADGWRSAYEASAEAYASLQGALRNVESSRDSLAAVLADRPGERPWYVPQIGIGPYAGVDATGRPSVGPVAITLNWRIRL
jgi:chromosome segregation ATPase